MLSLLSLHLRPNRPALLCTVNTNDWFVPTPSEQTGLLFSRSFFEGTLLAVNLRRGEFEVQDVKKS